MEKREKRKKAESSEPGFRNLEQALIRAEEGIGWKSLTAFLVTWTNANQPNDTAYSLKLWMQESKIIPKDKK